MDCNCEIPDFNLGKEIAKSLACGAAYTAGAVIGLMVIGLAYQKYTEIKKKTKTPR